MTAETGILTYYNDVKSKPVKWLWYPYIAVGKVTLLQGDPGDGKSTMMMNFIAELSKGGATPDGVAFGRPYKIIYQCSEDGASDTIKPRLEAAGADCRNIAFINEEVYGNLTLDDERIREAIIEGSPKLVVIDPIQSYIGNDSDLQIAVRARKLMRRISMWASTFNCAIVLIGHLSKRESSRELYRGLGSIDVVAAARSVLQVERDPEDKDIRIVFRYTFYAIYPLVVSVPIFSVKSICFFISACHFQSFNFSRHFFSYVYHVSLFTRPKSCSAAGYGFEFLQPKSSGFVVAVSLIHFCFPSLVCFSVVYVRSC